MDTVVRRVGTSLKHAAARSFSCWFGPHMAAASRAIAERIPLVDLVLEIRDARIPLSSENKQLKHFPLSARRIIVCNKVDLADCMQTKLWMKYFEQHKYIVYGVNSHNTESVKELLNFIQARCRDLTNINCSNPTVTILIVGIPNVGKSALANSLHQIGRISAEEKGKLKHATVSPLPGETKNIFGLKIGSHPNIYVLDTPGILPPKILDRELYSKLALTGVISDSSITAVELAEKFLTLLNSSGVPSKWLTADEPVIQKKQFASDHTQDFIVHDVRRTLYEIASSPHDVGNLQKVIASQFVALRDPLRVCVKSSDEDTSHKVATKLLDLFRAGRLGHYTLDRLPPGVSSCQEFG